MKVSSVCEGEQCEGEGESEQCEDEGEQCPSPSLTHSSLLPSLLYPIFSLPPSA